MTYTLEGYGEMEVILCGKCGIQWGAPADYIRARRSDGAVFHCPNGHPRAYNQPPSELDRMRLQLAAKDKQLLGASLQQDEMQAQLQKAERALIRLKKKAAAK